MKSDLKQKLAISLILACSFVGGSLPSLSMPSEAKKEPGEEKKTIVELTNPAVLSGLKLRVTGRKIVIGEGQIQAGEKLTTISQPTKVVVPPAGFLGVTDDVVRFTDNGKPTNIAVLTKCRAALDDSAILRGVLVPDSLKVKSAPGGDAPAFTKDRDYTVDNTFGAIKLMTGGSIKPGDKVYTEYQCWRRRIDSIAFDPSTEQFVLIQGVPARSAPEPPEVASTLIPLANVYTDWGDGDIPVTDVMPVQEREPPPNTKLIEHNRRAMAPIIKKLQEGQPVHIVFWGDGVTQGFDARSKEKTFAYLFIKQLRAAFPKASLTMSNLGIAGSNSLTRLPMVKIEVFGLKPDVVIVEFADDFTLPSHVLQKDYQVLLQAAKEKNVRVILCSPHCPAPRMARAMNWEAVADRPYIPVLRELASNNDFVALADVFERWEHLPKEGLHLDWLYVNGLNNPNNRGHAIYAEELMRCFASPKIASQQQ